MLRNLGIAIFLLSTIPFADSQTQIKHSAPVRLALVDVGAGEKIPGPLLDLLLVSFNKHPEIDLLERIDVNRLMKEQALSLALSNSEIIEAGRFWAVDAFLMMELLGSGGNRFLRIRLVDARQGLKYWDATLPFVPGTDKYAEQAAAIALSASLKAAKLSDATGNLIMAGVADFRSEELSKRWDWLSETLAAGIEQNLAIRPGVILLERIKARTLIEERSLVSGLPDALRPCVIFIDGAYRIQREKGPDAVSIHLRCRKEGLNPFELRLEGSLNNLGALYKKAVTAIICKLGKNPDLVALNPRFEAEMLASEAQAYIVMNNPERAIYLAEAALSLMPDSIDYKIIFLESSRRILQRCFSDLVAYRGHDKRKDLMDLFLSSCFRAFSAARRIAAAYELNRDLKLAVSVDGFINDLLNWCRMAPRDYGTLDPEEKDAFYELCLDFWSLYSLSLESFSAGNAHFFDRLFYLGNNAYVVCGSVDQAIELSRKILQNRQYGYGALSSLVEALRFPSFVDWPRDSRTSAKIAAYLNEMTLSDNPEIRALAEKASIEFYSEIRTDYLEAGRHCKKFIELIKNERFFIRDDFSIDFVNPIAYRKFAPDSNADAAIKTRHLSDLVGYIYSGNLIGNGHYFLENQLAFAVEFLAQQEEKKGRPEESAVLLRRAMGAIKNLPTKERIHAALKSLEIKYPRISTKPEDLPKARYTWQLLFNAADSDPHFRRLIVVNGSVQGIIYSDAEQLRYSSYGAWDGAAFGVINLSEDTYQPLKRRTIPFRFKCGTRGMTGRDEYGSNGPSVAAFKGALYLGVPQNGIVIMSEDGRSEIINEDRGLASNDIRTLDVLDGKLYAGIGGFQEASGLVEVDPESRVSRTLFSSRSKDSGGELDGKHICGIAADAERNGLWILASDKDGRRQIYFYSPQNQGLGRLDNLSLSESLKGGLDNGTCSSFRKIGDILVVEGIDDYVKIELKTGNGTLLLSTSEFEFPLMKKKWWKYFEWEQAPRRTLPIGEDFVGLNSTELIFFRDGEKEPLRLERYLEPGGRTPLILRDMALTKDGLLVLTDRALYRIPEIGNDNEPKTGNITRGLKRMQ